MTILDIGIAVAIGLAAFFGRRAIAKLDKLDDRGQETNIILARMDERDSKAEESIKTLRDRTHKHANSLQQHETRITVLEDKSA